MAELNIDKMAHNVAEKALDEFLYKGKSIREWIQIIISKDCISKQAAIDIIESWLSCDDYNEAERHIMRAMQSVLYDLPPVNPQEPLTEEDYIELRDRFGEYVVFVVRDMVSGKNERWSKNNPQELKTVTWSIKDVADTLAKHGLIVEQEAKTGHWYIDERPESDREVICSNCEQPIFKYHKLDFDYRPNYCPNCGAKMQEDKE